MIYESERIWKEVVVVYFKVLTLHFPRRTTINLNQETRFSWPTFEIGTSGIRSRRFHHSTETFGFLLLYPVFVFRYCLLHGLGWGRIEQQMSEKSNQENMWAEGKCTACILWWRYIRQRLRWGRPETRTEILENPTGRRPFWRKVKNWEINIKMALGWILVWPGLKWLRHGDCASITG